MDPLITVPPIFIICILIILVWYICHHCKFKDGFETNERRDIGDDREYILSNPVEREAPWPEYMYDYSPHDDDVVVDLGLSEDDGWSSYDSDDERDLGHAHNATQIYTISKTRRSRRSKRHRRPISGQPRQSRSFSEVINPESSNSGVIVAVDATPRKCGGYCIRKESGSCEFYSMGKERLPWRLHDLTRQGDPAEFEMKNLMAALLNWEGIIVESGKVWVYTDNNAIKRRGNGWAHGSNVRAFLRHLQNCCGVRIMNSNNHHLHRHKQPESFLKYLLPADHLSRGLMVEFYLHMQIYFPNILNFAQDKDLARMEQRCNRWVEQRCPTCGFCIRETDSLRKKSAKRRPSFVPQLYCNVETRGQLSPEVYYE